MGTVERRRALVVRYNSDGLTTATQDVFGGVGGRLFYCTGRVWKHPVTNCCLYWTRVNSKDVGGDEV
jgi:hypothetical protein